MSLSVAIVGLCLGIVVWVLLVRELRTKSWEPQPAIGDAADAEEGENQTPPARIGLWVFLAVVTSLFGLFISAYYMRMGFGHGARFTGTRLGARHRAAGPVAEHAIADCGQRRDAMGAGAVSRRAMVVATADGTA